MHDITLEIEIETRDEHLDFQFCVPFISSHYQAVGLRALLRLFEFTTSALNLRESPSRCRPAWPFDLGQHIQIIVPATSLRIDRFLSFLLQVFLLILSLLISSGLTNALSDWKHIKHPYRTVKLFMSYFLCKRGAGWSDFWEQCG